MDELAPETAKYLGPPVDSRGVVAKRKLRLGSAESLAALAEEWSFFTPAVPYLKGRFTDAFLVDFMFSLGRDVDFHFYKFQSPMFRGLETSTGDPDWNSVVWAVRPDEWAALSPFLCGLSVAHKDAKALWRFGVQPVTVLDPIASTRLIASPVPATVEIQALGIYGNTCQWFFTPGANRFLPPRLGRHAPDEEDAAFAEAYFGGSNPFAAKDAVEYEKIRQKGIKS